jgi:hypothetical protein
MSVLTVIDHAPAGASSGFACAVSFSSTSQTGAKSRVTCFWIAATARSSLEEAEEAVSEHAYRLGSGEDDEVVERQELGRPLRVLGG